MVGNAQGHAALAIPSEHTGNVKVTRPQTGQEYLDSLRDDRTVYIYGERVRDVTEHPAFRNTARMIARLYDALHRDQKEGKGVLTCPTEWGGFTHRYFQAPRSAEELVAGRVQQGQPATVHPGQVSGQLFGIATRGIDSRIGE